MEPLYLYNTLSRKKEEFAPIKAGAAGLYTCGPTVYNYAHIGNLRSFIFEDVLKRVLAYNGYEVRHIMNITDVGHLTGDRDMGEDKLEKGAKREGKTAWEIADFYIAAFKDDIRELNIIEADEMPRATDYIDEQIKLVKILEDKGYTYRISDGIYFDTAKFKEYNKLNHKNLEDLREGARVEKNEEKKNPTDFALWKFSPPGAKRHMEWDSPWGKGFPGWHIECSAMSRARLGDQLDIHCGGVDHIDVHHTNEIAQSEAAYGGKFFNYWLHGAFLNIEGGKKMAKSEDNFLTLEKAFKDQGLDPLVFRYAALQTHYRKPMEYSGEAMRNAEQGLRHLHNQAREIGSRAADRVPRTAYQDYGNRFLSAINDDMNMPQAMAVVQEALKSGLDDSAKLAAVLDFDQVLGLKLDQAGREDDLPAEVRELIDIREQARSKKDWDKADQIRRKIEDLGYQVEDTAQGMRVARN